MNNQWADRNKSVLILSTGGTMGMRSSTGSLSPDRILHDLTKWLPELSDYAKVKVEILTDIDSSSLMPSLWLELAQRIKTAIAENECTGIVIIHGTDTLAYTASALSFLLPGLTLPVVLTGGQRPLGELRTDSRNNVFGAVESALEGPDEVMIFFYNKALRGNRATNVAIDDFDCFDSPNYPPLGEAGIIWNWESGRFWPKTRRPTLWSLPTELPSPPMVLPYVPGMPLEHLLRSVNNHWAIILEAFGTGNMPFSDTIKAELKTYLDRGGLIFIKSQALKGNVLLEAYAPGKAMQEMGILGGHDMTREAMVTKIMVLQSMGLSQQELKYLMTQSLAGELTEKTKIPCPEED